MVLYHCATSCDIDMLKKITQRKITQETRNLIDCIKMYIDSIVSAVPETFVSNAREMIGISEEMNNIQKLQDLKEKLINLG